MIVWVMFIVAVAALAGLAAFLWRVRDVDAERQELERLTVEIRAAGDVPVIEGGLAALRLQAWAHRRAVR